MPDFNSCKSNTKGELISQGDRTKQVEQEDHIKEVQSI